MSITDELREYVDMFKDKVAAPATLCVIADHIDAAHEREVTMARGEAVAKLGNKVAREYVKLPVDADGEPIHVGDKLKGYKETIVVDEMALQYGSWALVSEERQAFYCPEAFTHHHEPTVEDVLRDFAKCWDDPVHYAKGELVEAFAAKLQLRED